MLRLGGGIFVSQRHGKRSQLREALRRTKQSEQESEKQKRGLSLDLIPVPDALRPRHASASCGLCGVKERDMVNSLSNHVWLMARLHFKGAEVFP
jgi:hypothetical protein